MNSLIFPGLDKPAKFRFSVANNSLDLVAIKNIIEGYFKTDISINRRMNTISIPRHYFRYFAYWYTNKTLQDIGDFNLGNTDTILSSIRWVYEKTQNNMTYNQIFADLQLLIEDRFDIVEKKWLKKGKPLGTIKKIIKIR